MAPRNPIFGFGPYQSTHLDPQTTLERGISPQLFGGRKPICEGMLKGSGHLRRGYMKKAHYDECHVLRIPSSFAGWLDNDAHYSPMIVWLNLFAKFPHPQYSQNRIRDQTCRVAPCPGFLFGVPLEFRVVSYLVLVDRPLRTVPKPHPYIQRTLTELGPVPRNFLIQALFEQGVGFCV